MHQASVQSKSKPRHPPLTRKLIGSLSGVAARIAPEQRAASPRPAGDPDHVRRQPPPPHPPQAILPVGPLPQSTHRAATAAAGDRENRSLPGGNGLRTDDPLRSGGSSGDRRHRGTGQTREESMAHSAQRAQAQKKRKRKERETSADRARLQRRHVELSESSAVPGFALENTPHELPGYAGMKDRGVDHRFLSGPAHQRLERLRSLGYETIREPDDDSL